MDAVREELTRVVCPEPDHQSPCSVPWAPSYTDSEEDAVQDAKEAADDSEDEEEAHLEQQYGHLRER